MLDAFILKRNVCIGEEADLATRNSHPATDSGSFSLILRRGNEPASELLSHSLRSATVLRAVIDDNDLARDLSVLQVGQKPWQILPKDFCSPKRGDDDAKVDHANGGLIIAPKLSLVGAPKES